MQQVQKCQTLLCPDSRKQVSPHRSLFKMSKISNLLGVLGLWQQGDNQNLQRQLKMALQKPVGHVTTGSFINIYHLYLTKIKFNECNIVSSYCFNVPQVAT